MKKNYSDLIKSKENRTLTAKGYKFLWKCIDVVADNKGLSRYSKDLKGIKEKLRLIIEQLIIDEEKTLQEIKSIIKNRVENKAFIVG